MQCSPKQASTKYTCIW